MYKDIISDGKGERMKRILLIIFIFALFIFYGEAFAKTAVFSGAEFLDNISYVKYDGSYYYFKKAMAIRNVDSGNIAYCLEPFEALVDGSTYTGYKKFDTKFNLSKKQWDRIRKIAYYGYGYQGHLSQKWITITQFLIWRTVDSNSSFNWIDNVYDRNVIYPYNKEINELESLIKNHEVVPNISENIKMGINSTIEIEDSSKVLNDFEVKYADFDVTIRDNVLIIKSSEEKSGKIILKKKEFASSDVEFFYANGTQSVIERGKVESIEFPLNIEVISGSIEIKKVDSSNLDMTPLGEASLVGAVYGVYDNSSNLVGEVVIGSDNSGILSNLSFGAYYVKEIKAGNGYRLDQNEYFVRLDEESPNSSLILSNDVIQSKIIITKYFGTKNEYDSKTMKVESGIIFEIYDINNSLVYSGSTNDFGKLEVTLPYGSYIIKQINTTYGYSKVDDIFVTIDEQSSDDIYFSLTDLKAEVPNASIFSYDMLLFKLFDVVLKRFNFVI